MGINEQEATLEKLLADPMMPLVFDHYRTTADDVRSLMRDARERLAKVKAVESE